MEKIKLLLADDHPIFLDGLHSLLKTVPTMEVVAKASDGEEALHLILSENIDIAILDIDMPKIDGIELARSILKKKPATKIILLTMLNAASYMVNAYDRCIHGYVLKDKSTETLVDAIHAVARGNNYWPFEYMEIIRTAKSKQETLAGNVAFTDRETQILCLLAEESGLSNKDLAERLFIAEFTVQTHLQNARKKLGVKSTRELINYAIRNNLCDLKKKT